MALHSKLPIYKAAYDLLSVAMDYVQNMPRSIKPVLGKHVSKSCLELVILIAKANAAKNKVPYLDTMIERLEELQIILRLCHDKRFISRAQYAKGVELTASVGKQANGWRNYSAKISPVT